MGTYKKFKLPETQDREVIKSSKKIFTASLVEVEESDMQMAGKNSEGDLYFSFILTTSGSNENKQVFMDEDLKNPEILKAIKGQPIDEDHEQSFEKIVGEILDAEYLPENNDRPSAVKCKAVIFHQYSEIIHKIRRGAGKWAAMSMEAVPNPLERVGEYLVIHNPIFVGAGIVRFPGNKHSKIDTVDNLPVKTPGDQNDKESESIEEADSLLLVAKKALGILSAKKEVDR